MTRSETRAPHGTGRGSCIAVHLRFSNLPNPRRDPRSIFPVAVAALLALGTCSPPNAPAVSSRGGPPYLLLHDWYGTSPVATPSYLRDHREYLDSLPFDGVVLYLRSPDHSLNVTASILDPKEIGEEEFDSVLAPLKGLPLRNLTENFAAVLGGRPPDFMDDWSAVVSNFARLAKAARNAGLKGIYFDNETYYAPWSDYPRGVGHPDLTLAEYQAQARKRGREIMEAVNAVYPEITVILLHGPYISEPGAPGPLFPRVQNHNELHGPFFAGFVEGAGPLAKVVDGGELYHLRSEDDFRSSRDWRKRMFPSKEVDCAFLPSTLRECWKEKVEVSFGVIDRPFQGLRMDPSVLAATLSRALRFADRHAWLYVEGPTFLKPPGEGGAPESWIEAVRRARANARPPAP